MSKEYIISPPVQSYKTPFAITLAGITYEDPSYIINRAKNSGVFTMEYVISGKGHIIVNGKEYTAEAGDSYILTCGQNTRYYSDKINPWRKIWFNAHGAFLNETARIFGLDSKIVFHDVNTLAYFEKILKICENTVSADEINMMCAPIFTELIMFISNETNKNSSISDEAMTLKGYIDSHIEENISIEFLSKLIFRSESQTIRIFKKNFDMTPYEYLLKNKINRAEEIILNTNLPIKEIAYRLGFSDEHYFSGIFRKRTGASPTEYRKRG